MKKLILISIVGLLIMSSFVSARMRDRYIRAGGAAGMIAPVPQDEEICNLVKANPGVFGSIREPSPVGKPRTFSNRDIQAMSCRALMGALNDPSNEITKTSIVHRASAKTTVGGVRKYNALRASQSVAEARKKLLQRTLVARVKAQGVPAVNIKRASQAEIDAVVQHCDKIFNWITRKMEHVKELSDDALALLIQNQYTRVYSRACFKEAGLIR